MAHTNAGWPTNIPAGGDNLNTADDQLRRLRLDLKERFNDFVDDITADPIVLSDIDVGIVIGTPDAASVYTNAASSLPSSGTRTLINFVAETFDTGAFHDNSSNPSRLTIATAAYYRITANITVVPGATEVTASCDIRKNGTIIASVFAENAASNPHTFMVTVIDLAAATDYYEVSINQLSGDAWVTASVAASAFFMIERLVGTT